MSFDLIEKIKKDDIKFVDLRFTDTLGKEQHISLPKSQINKDFLKYGKFFDGSSIKGWCGINKSDMVLMPCLNNYVLDPFATDKTLILRCDILEPENYTGYQRDPRTIAKKAEKYLKNTKIATDAYFGPEPEFFIFDDIKFETSMGSSFYHIGSKEASWFGAQNQNDTNLGHRPKVKGGYFPVPPVDSCYQIRAQMSNIMEKMGLIVEAHHHEVATAGQNEIATRFNSLVAKADEIQIYKYVVHNVANNLGKTATFMPKPIKDDNGSGMHCHFSLSNNGENIFAGDEYASLSKTALYFIGGIIKHAKAINAFTNPTTNSYKRLIPGFEAPVSLAYSKANRSASIRIPAVNSTKERRIEIRFPDASANPYLAFSAILMAGLDGIQNKIDPGKPFENDLYNPTDACKVRSVASSLEQALDSLEKDRDFLKKGDVFTDDVIDTYISLKKEEIQTVATPPTPIEFELYYSV